MENELQQLEPTYRITQKVGSFWLNDEVNGSFLFRGSHCCQNVSEINKHLVPEVVDDRNTFIEFNISQPFFQEKDISMPLGSQLETSSNDYDQIPSTLVADLTSQSKNIMFPSPTSVTSPALQILYDEAIWLENMILRRIEVCLHLHCSHFNYFHVVYHFMFPRK